MRQLRRRLAAVVVVVATAVKTGTRCRRFVGLKSLLFPSALLAARRQVAPLPSRHRCRSIRFVQPTLRYTCASPNPRFVQFGRVQSGLPYYHVNPRALNTRALIRMSSGRVYSLVISTCFHTRIRARLSAWSGEKDSKEGEDCEGEHAPAPTMPAPPLTATALIHDPPAEAHQLWANVIYRHHRLTTRIMKYRDLPNIL